MKILVTGAAGFIGSHFVDYVLERHPEDEIVSVDSLTYAGRLENLSSAMQDPRFTFIRADIADAEAMKRVFKEERPDAVVNFAAHTHVDRSIESAREFVRSNVLGTEILLEEARLIGARFHQISTDEVYGALPLDRGDPFTEDSPLLPTNPYAATKAAADLLALSYFKTHGLFVTVSRASNNYGPRQYPEKLIPKLTAQAAADTPLSIYGNGKNLRDWIHVLDHCEAVDLILRGGRAGTVYNVGGGPQISSLEIARLILSCLGKGEELISFVEDRPGHDARYALDSALIKRELGWEPKRKFDREIEKTVLSYLTEREK